MFDAKPPKDADRPGGLGEPFGWTLLEGRRFARPWLLAGGLAPANIAAMLSQFRHSGCGPAGLDINSGVEGAPRPAIRMSLLTLPSGEKPR